MARDSVTAVPARALAAERDEKEERSMAVVSLWGLSNKAFTDSLSLSLSLLRTDQGRGEEAVSKCRSLNAGGTVGGRRRLRERSPPAADV